MTIKKHSVISIAWLFYFIILLNFYNIPGIQTFSLIGIVILTLFCIPYNIRKSNLYISKWYFVFFCYMTISFIWAISNEINTLYEGVFRILCFVICLDLYCDSEKNTRYMINVILFAILTYAIHIIILTPISDYGTLNVGSVVGDQRNYVGQVCSLGSVIAFIRLMEQKGIQAKIPYIFYIAITYFVACISGSRKALLILPLSIIVYTYTRNSLNKKIKYLFLLIGIFAVCLTIFAQIPYFQDFFGTRLLAIFDESIYDGSIEGRDYLQAVALNLFYEHPILGAGCDNFRIYLVSLGYPRAVYAHNNYLEIMANYGLLGLLLYYRCHIRNIVKSVRWGFDSVYTKLIFVFLLANMFMDYGQVSYQTNMYIYMLVVICSSVKWMKTNNSIKKREDDY